MANPSRTGIRHCWAQVKHTMPSSMSLLAQEWHLARAGGDGQHVGLFLRWKSGSSAFRMILGARRANLRFRWAPRAWRLPPAIRGRQSQGRGLGGEGYLTEGTGAGSE